MGMTTYVFVDGAYVRESMAACSLDWSKLSVGAMADSLQRLLGNGWQGEGFTVARTFLYDAVLDPSDVDEEQASKGVDPKVVEAWLTKNNDQYDTHVRRGRLAVKKPRRQKRVDVQLAVDALQFAYHGIYDVAILVAADADYAPLVEALRDLGKLVLLCLFERRPYSEELAEVADRVGEIDSDF